MAENNILAQLELLKQVQSIDSQIREIEQAYAELPLKLRKLEEQRDRERKDINAAKADIVSIDRERDRLEKEIAFDRDALANFESKSKAVSSNDAYQAALKELDNRKKIIRGKEEQALRLMEQADTVRKKIEQLEEDFKQVAVRYEAQETELREKVEIAKQESAGLVAQRDGIAKQIDPPTLARYRTIFGRRDGIAVVAVIGEICQGCDLGMPPQIVNDARAGRGVQTCSNCHRIIYWAPRTAPAPATA